MRVRTIVTFFGVAGLAIVGLYFAFGGSPAESHGAARVTPAAPAAPDPAGARREYAATLQGWMRGKGDTMLVGTDGPGSTGLGFDTKEQACNEEVLHAFLRALSAEELRKRGFEWVACYDAGGAHASIYVP